MAFMDQITIYFHLEEDVTRELNIVIIMTFARKRRNNVGLKYSVNGNSFQEENIKFSFTCSKSFDLHKFPLKA